MDRALIPGQGLNPLLMPLKPLSRAFLPQLRLYTKSLACVAPLLSFTIMDSPRLPQGDPIDTPPSSPGGPLPALGPALPSPLPLPLPAAQFSNTAASTAFASPTQSLSSSFMANCTGVKGLGKHGRTSVSWVWDHCVELAPDHSRLQNGNHKAKTTHQCTVSLSNIVKCTLWAGGQIMVTVGQSWSQLVANGRKWSSMAAISRRASKIALSLLFCRAGFWWFWWSQSDMKADIIGTGEHL
jgi:hypothetical protein